MDNLAFEESIATEIDQSELSLHLYPMLVDMSIGVKITF